MFNRAMVFNGGMPKLAAQGDGWLSAAKPTRNITDSNQNIPLTAILGGVWSHTVTVTRADTTPDGATVIAAAVPAGGDRWFFVSRTSATNIDYLGV